MSPAAIPQGCEGSGARLWGSRVTCTLVQLASSRIAQVSAVAPTGKELGEPVEGGESLGSEGPPHSSVLLDAHHCSTCTLRTSFHVELHSPWTCVSLWDVSSLGPQAWFRTWGGGGRGSRGPRASGACPRWLPARVTRLGLSK